MSDQQKIPPLTEILPKYEGIYPSETVEAAYLYLIGRIKSLTPIVEKNMGAPLISKAERESCEKGEEGYEIAKRAQNNKATKKALDDCKVAWQRLVDGIAHLCTECGGKIDKDRKQAVPAASKCMKCQEKKGLRVFQS